MASGLRAAATAVALLVAAGAASAQSSFPSKPVHIFVPYPAGGGALNTEPVKERLAKLGALPIASSPQQFDAKIRGAAVS